MDNDYTRLAIDIEHAAMELDSLDAVDPDIEYKIEDAKSALAEAKALAEARA